MAQSQYPPNNPTAPREPAYGEVAETEAARQAAPLAGEETPPTPPTPESPQEAGPEPAQPTGPPRNIISVLPPESSAPSETGILPQTPIKTTAKTLLAMPGIDPSVRALAFIVLGNFTGPGYAEGPLPASPPETEETP